MESLIASSFRALRSLFAPGMLSVFVTSILVTIAALIGFVICSSAFFSWLAPHMQAPLVHTFLPWLGSIGSFILAWLLFPGIMPVIISFFDERIAALIERQDYPDAGPLRTPEFWSEFLHDMRFSAKAIFYNILVLPLYLVPVINLFLFYLLNGYLLGREFFTMAARRHMPIHEAEALRDKHGRTILAAGIALSVLATIPLLNLLAPFWGVAVMVHLYHRLRSAQLVEILPPTP